MNGQPSKAVEFLQRLRPGGPWKLSAIPVEGGKPHQRFFTQTGDMFRWLTAHDDGDWNLYYEVNPPRDLLAKKSEKTDIHAVTHLMVDIDPRAGEDLIAEQARIRSLFNERLPTAIPRPTFCIFSGGGLQAGWALSKPIVLDGTVETAEQAERYNKQLTILFDGADDCFTVEHLWRLPHTVNLPGKKKRAKGRTPVVATVEWFDDAAVYPLDTFTPAPGEPPPPGNVPQVVINNVKRVADINELDEWCVPDRVKELAVTVVAEGDRSEPLFDFVCNALRAGVPDETIFAIITDPTYPISASVLEKGSRAERYALKQLRDAKEQVIEPWLRKLNSRHAVVRNLGGKCRIIEELPDPTFAGRTCLTKQSFDDFRNAYMHIKVQAGKGKDGSPLFMALGKWWLEHPMRRQYDFVYFDPAERRERPEAYNLWKGFAVDPVAGDCSLFLQHVANNICGGNRGLYTYVIGWLARLVQKPASIGETAIALRGGQGVGKSFFANTVGSLLGQHYMAVSDPKHLVGNFNSHLQDCLLLFADEAFYAGDKRHESILKTLITEETLAIERKGVDVEKSRNYIHLILASNSSWVVPTDLDDRRFLVLDVGDAHKQDSDYFGDIKAQLDAGGYAALLHSLLHHDISGFNHRKLPWTRAKDEQKEYGFTGANRVMYTLLVDGQENTTLVDGGNVFIACDPLAAAGKLQNSKALGHQLRAISLHPEKRAERATVDGRQVRGRWLPSLGESRRRWSKLVGIEVRWPDDDGQWAGVEDIGGLL